MEENKPNIPEMPDSSNVGLTPQEEKLLKNIFGKDILKDSPADQVVKELDWFLDEVAKECGLKNWNHCQTIWVDGIDSYSVKLEATERWYKHQLEEKDKAKKTLIGYISQYQKQIETLTATIAERDRGIIGHEEAYHRVAMRNVELVAENTEFRTTIEEQKKKIEKLRQEENKFYEDQISKQKLIIDNLTQENGSLKNRECWKVKIIT